MHLFIIRTYYAVWTTIRTFTCYLKVKIVKAIHTKKEKLSYNKNYVSIHTKGQ